MCTRNLHVADENAPLCSPQFMCEVDNLIYAVGLQERVRARVEKAGRVDLVDTDTVVLNRMKLCYAVVVLAAVFSGIVRGGLLKEGMQIGEDNTFQSSFACFFVGNVVEAATTPGTTTKERLRGVALAICCFVVGYIVFRGMFRFTS